MARTIRRDGHNEKRRAGGRHGARSCDWLFAVARSGAAGLNYRFGGPIVARF
jgi:hypothetical protein